MAVQEQIARVFTVGIRPPAEAADGYHVIYAPRGPQRVGGAGDFHALGNGGPRQVGPPIEAVVHLQGEDVVVQWASAPEDLAAVQGELEQDAKDRVRLLRGWLDRLSALVNDVETWVKDLGWATRRIDKSMEDSQIGKYKAPALLMQEGTDRVLLEPIARSAPGAEGVVDLYLMPAYDDIASLYYADGRWNLHYVFSGTGAANTHEAPAKPLSQDTLREVLAEMRDHAT
jgi:hypothetical protein